MSDWSDLLGLGLQVGSTILGTGAQIERGNAAELIGQRRKALADYEATQLDLEAEQSQGIGMRAAQDEILKAGRINSTALARAAASGAGASDPTVMNIIAQTAGEGAYRSAVAMYEGEAQARLDRMRAQALRFEGETAASDADYARRASYLGAGYTALSGGLRGLSMYDRFWSR